MRDPLRRVSRSRKQCKSEATLREWKASLPTKPSPEQIDVKIAPPWRRYQFSH
ncbi:UNKNOWN [Stylonychia lemnae]|uniref:Uncharacterized protein n=1 Tax=Stylonychia lemnae TaxID=5949 RepID=A0A078AGY7_STYLE|nr:UNKNOWN [Stylonychia lemnae]|eukprot:CDW81530.1 UNKNOWN [Stylonychia lemnae]